MSKGATLALTNILGTDVTCGSHADVIGYILERIEQKLPTRIAFLNAHLANMCAREAGLRSSLRQFLVLNDGIGVEIAARVLHRRAFAANLNGTDFTPMLLDAAPPLRIFLLGAQRDVVASASAAIEARWPRHRVVGVEDGFFGPDRSLDVLRNVSEAAPDLVLVGMGNPRQERWIAENVPGTCCCAIAIGAWFDFVTKRVPRAPLWVRRARLEWVFRLCCEPRRLANRYLLGIPEFLFRVMRERIAHP